MTLSSITATITPDHQLIAKVPSDIVPGKYEIELTIKNQPGASAARGPLELPSYPAGLRDPHLTLRREDLYGPGGR